MKLHTLVREIEGSDSGCHGKDVEMKTFLNCENAVEYFQVKLEAKTTITCYTSHSSYYRVNLFQYSVQ